MRAAFSICVFLITLCAFLLGIAAESSADIRYVYVIVKPQKYQVDKTNATQSTAHFPSGAYSAAEHDHVVAARGIPMVWERNYRSNAVGYVSGGQLVYNAPADGPLGYGWTNGWLVRINGDSYINGYGRSITFIKGADGNYLTNTDEGLRLKKTASGYELLEFGRFTYTFDTDGNLQTVGDSHGNTARLTYSSPGKPASITDAAGRVAFTISYDAAGRISTVTSLAGRTITYEYDGFGNLAVVRRDGNVAASYTYNASHGIVSKSNALGETWSIDYYPRLVDKGMVKRIIDPVGTELLKQGLATAGHETSFMYDYDAKVFYTTDYNGNVFVKTVNNNGDVVAVDEIKNGERVRISTVTFEGRTATTTDAKGNKTIIQKDEWGRIIKQTDGEGGVRTSTYTVDQKLLTFTDELGIVTRNDYDAGNLVKTTWAVGLPEETSTTYGYDAYGQAVSETTGGATKTAIYNDQGLPTTITDEEGNSVNYTYDSTGSVTGYTDALGNTTAYTYDAAENLTTKTDPLKNVTTYSYNAANRLISITDPLGHAVRYETDFNGRMTALVDALGNRTEFSYDGNGNRTKATRGDSVITMAYDSSNRMTSFTDPEGNTTTYSYQPSGCASCGAATESLDKIIDSLGNVVSYTYDKAMRLTGLTDPLKNVTTFERDAAGQTVGIVDANSNVTGYQRDALKRPVRKTDANGNDTSFTYDVRGNLIGLTDANGNSTSYEYNRNQLVVKETSPIGNITEYSYYGNTLVKTAKDPKGQVRTYSYDKAARLTQIAYADGKKDTFTYDAAGNLTGHANENATVSITYDDANRKTSETVTLGGITKTIQYAYDAKGNRSSLTTSDGNVITYTYDKNNRIKMFCLSRKWTFRPLELRECQLVLSC